MSDFERIQGIIADALYVEKVKVTRRASLEGWLTNKYTEKKPSRSKVKSMHL